MPNTLAQQSGPLPTDALVIGAGPVGLFQVFELGLQDIRSHVLDVLPHAGGQCMELYPDKPIFDIPGVPVCTGRQLTDRLLEQIAPLKATFHFSQLVNSLERQADGRFLVTTSRNQQFLAKTVFIAAGVGAFQPRSIKLEGIEVFEGSQLLHGVEDPSTLIDKDIVIAGDGDQALDWALRLCAGNADGFVHKARKVTVLHRRDVFTAAESTVQRFRELVAGGHLQLRIGQATGFESMQGHLTALRVTDPDTNTQPLPLDLLLVLQGLSPRLGPVAHWALDIERKQLRVDTEKFSTSEPGIFAIGDINTYPGKRKLIVCGFHEATLAAFAAAAIVFPDQKVLLQYTTTSTKLHKTLGLTLPID